MIDWTYMRLNDGSIQRMDSATEKVHLLIDLGHGVDSVKELKRFWENVVRMFGTDKYLDPHYVSQTVGIRVLYQLRFWVPLHSVEMVEDYEIFAYDEGTPLFWRSE